MYVIEPCKIEIRIIDKNGIVEVYPDYNTFLNKVTYYFVDKYITDVISDYPPLWILKWDPYREYPKYIIRDMFGGVYSRNEILHDIRKLNSLKQIYKINKKYRFDYRYDPVPFTGKKRGKFKNWYKIPKVTQEKKWSFAYKEYVRGKRKKHNLPNPWDDYQRSDIRERKNWKHYKKKKQWM